MTDCNRQPLLFSSLGRQEVQADFAGGTLTSDGGGLLLREVDRQLGLIDEWSDPAQIAYTMDILGNMSLDRKNSGTSATETRAHNATNELTSRTINGEAPRYWVNDPFTDNDTASWEVADLDPNGSDGTWAASSGALACSAVCTPAGHSSVPGDGDISILLIDGAAYQDVYLSCSATLNANCDYAGLVFGYVDKDNFWVRLFDDPNDLVRVYEVSSGTWTQKNSASFTITTGSAFSMTAEVRAGAAHDYAGTVPGGQVGILCDEGTDNSFDDFMIRDIAGPFEADGLYFSSRGEVRTDNSNNNVIEAYATDGLEECIVRRGFRGDKYVATFKFKWNDDSCPGWLVRWLSPGDYLTLAISQSDGKARFYKRENDGTLTTVATSGTVLSLTTNTWYEAKVVIGSGMAGQAVRFWVDTDGDGDYSDETTLLNSSAGEGRPGTLHAYTLEL